MRLVNQAAARLAEAAVAARFAADLGPLLRRAPTAHEARALLEERVRHRDRDFLALTRLAIFGHGASPYRALLRIAGCEYPDLEQLVRGEGLDGALHRLARAGVYLTQDEFKGRQPVVRGSESVTVLPSALWNPLLRGSLLARTSGSRGVGLIVPDNVGFDQDLGLGMRFWMLAHGGGAIRTAAWYVPGGAAVAGLVVLTAAGHRPERWFSQVDPSAPGLHSRYAWSARILRWTGLAVGRPLPSPEYAPLRAPHGVVRWLRAVIEAGQTPFLITGVSAAIRLAGAAEDAGLDIRGTRAVVGGEPVTARRLAAIRSGGIEPIPWYSTMEAGIVALGCLAPNGPDDMHWVTNQHAVIQPGAAAATGDDTLYLTSLRPTARLVLLNVSLGDQATLENRACGCPLAGFGWAGHVHTVRSREKLTAAGMTFADQDVVHLLDEVLPARFGGGPTHYQLLEEETPEGQPRLTLLVHPSVGAFDAEAVRNVFLASLGAGSGAAQLMANVWRDANLLQVERRAPEATFTGKILHLHQRPSAHSTKPVGRATG